MTPKEALHECNHIAKLRGVSIHPRHGHMGHGPTGEVYRTLTSGGLQPEGCPVPATYDNETQAWVMFRAAFNRYIHQQVSSRGEALTLYWRMGPQIVEQQGPTGEGGETRYYVGCRLYCSSGPITHPEADWTEEKRESA